MSKKIAKLSSKSLVDVLRQAGRPVRLKDIFGRLGSSAAQKKQLKSMLAQLVQGGRVVATGKSFALPETLPRLTGVLDVRRSGVGYLVQDKAGAKDILLRPEHFGGAWPGDRVVAVVLPGRKKDAPQARVIEIVERAATSLVVRVLRRLKPRVYLARPVDSRLNFSCEVDLGDLAEPQPGDLLKVRALGETEPGWWQCAAQQVLGAEQDLSTQEGLVKTSHAIPQEFPLSVLRQAQDLPRDPSPADWAGREDLRHLALVTIDGETARDFDDAVYVERQDQGYRLVVAIADVDHYAPPGSALDQEARARGNSCYFPLSVEPMFPAALSNGLCSLVPGAPRLAVVVDAIYTDTGLPGPARFYPAVIQSQARLTYTQVQSVLDDNQGAVPAHLEPMLILAATLAQNFSRVRKERGCLDFDLPEAQITQENGQVRVGVATRLLSHHLIEEFMIATNERVAEFLGARQRVFPYRVHPEPDERKQEFLLQTLAHTALVDRLPALADRAGLRQIAAAAQDSDLRDLVGRLLLRTMMLAQYSPDNGGHFGLASAAYTHFTSPIRRYADLLVHRALKGVLAGQPENMDPDDLDALCQELNACERKAVEAEREIQKRAAILALQDRLGETMAGVISGVAEFGFWVELTEMPVDGLVRLATLDDYYVFDPGRQDLLGQRSGRVFKLGQRVDVVLEQVSLDRVEINFTLPKLVNGLR